MRILIDTNILIDSLLGREPFSSDADRLVKLCADKKVDGYIAAHSISNMFYILRNKYSPDDRRAILLNLCQILKVEGIDEGKIMAGLCNSNFKDFEDCLQYECAAALGVKYIITRNSRDFSGCNVSVKSGGGWSTAEKYEIILPGRT